MDFMNLQKQIPFYLLYYIIHKKKKVEKYEIYMLDVGANIGWYTFTLGKEVIMFFLLSLQKSIIIYYSKTIVYIMILT